MKRLKSKFQSIERSRIRRLAAEGGWILVGQIAVVVGALVLVRVLTAYLDPKQYGELALGLTVAGLMNQVIMGGIIAGIGRFYAIAAERRDLGGYFFAARYILGCATVGVVLIGLILIACLCWLGYSEWIGLASAALMLSVMSGSNSAISGIQNAARQRVIVAFHGGLDAWLKIGLTVFVMAWLGITSVTAVVIGYACSSMLVTISQFIFLRRTIPQLHTVTSHQPWLPQIVAYSLPFTIWGGFTWIQQASDRWALQSFGTTSDVGHYAVLFQLGFTPVSLLTGVAMSFLGPILYQRSYDGTDPTRTANVYRLSWQLTYICFAATALGFAMTFALHDWLFRVLVAAEYRESSHLLPWLVLAGGIYAAGQILALRLMSDMKSSMMTTAKIATALIGALLNVIGAVSLGIAGVIGALVTFSCIYFTWMAILGHRTINHNTHDRSNYEIHPKGSAI